MSVYSYSTGQTDVYPIYIDATSPYISWDSDHVELILPPGNYRLTWNTDVGVKYYLRSHGWFTIAHDDPDEVNQVQNLIMLVTGFVGGFMVIGGIAFVSGNLRTDKKKEKIREKRLSKDEIKMQKLQEKMQKKYDKKAS